MKRLLLPLLFTIHLTPYSNVFDLPFRPFLYRRHVNTRTLTYPSIYLIRSISI